MHKRHKALLLALVMVGLLATGTWYLQQHGNIQVLNTKGTIGNEERRLIYMALVLSLIVVIPVFALLGVFAWRYREGNAKAKYTPDLDRSRVAETIWWLIPSVLILVLSVITWDSSHKLDPYKPLASNTKPLTIQVVSLNWKWLFIYPEQHVASVNFVQFPENRPIDFKITSDSVMNSFWIPQLGGQVYSMPGMQTELHLMADHTGSYAGSSANISGSGFSGMTFTARSSTQAAFDAWVRAAQKSTNTLNSQAYDALARPSKNNDVAYYAAVDPALYDTIINKYMMPGHAMSGNSGTKTTEENMSMDMHDMHMEMP